MSKPREWTIGNDAGNGPYSVTGPSLTYGEQVTAIELSAHKKAEDQLSILTWALRRAVDWLEYEKSDGLPEVLKILRVNGLEYDEDGRLVGVSAPHPPSQGC